MKKSFKLHAVLSIAASLFPLICAADSGSPVSEKEKKISVYTTAKDSNQRLTLSDTLTLKPGSQPLETDVAVFVYPSKRFQTFLGMGGAITDSSAEVFDILKSDKKSELLKAYYDPHDGIGYSLLRTTIHSSDFSRASYTYINEGDKSLSSFSIAHDKKYRLPMIKKAIAAAGGQLTTYASPWSAPAFMKTTNNMLKGGKLLPEYHQAWALYYTKFIKAYEQAGVPIWGITVQNEPMATQTWESMIYTAEEERDFLKNYLGPTMSNAGLGEKKIVVWDHNRDLITHRAHTILSDPGAAKYVWGVGFHWYEPWTGGDPMHRNVADVKQAFPDINLMLTEATVEKFSTDRLQHWPNAERYGNAIINDFNAGAVAWTDWNILLDEKGGPNHVGNFCFAPVHANTQTGELIYTPSFYYLGHFSKFIRPQAERVSATASRSALLVTSFQNDDASLITVVMNEADTAIQYRFYIDNLETRVTIPARAIQTLKY